MDELQQGDELKRVSLQDIKLKDDEQQGNEPSDSGDGSESVTNPLLTSLLAALHKKQEVGRRGIHAEVSFESGSLLGGVGFGEASAGAGGFRRLPRQLLNFVGFVDKLPIEPSVLRIYTCLDLKNGVDVLEDDVLHRERLEPDPRDGQRRDVVFVDFDADVIYWSRTPPRTIREPGGGNGFPYPERI